MALALALALAPALCLLVHPWLQHLTLIRQGAQRKHAKLTKHSQQSSRR